MNYTVKRDIIRGRNGDLASTITQLARLKGKRENAKDICDVIFQYDGEAGWSCSVYYFHSKGKNAHQNKTY